jgi:hypothetical protein
VRTPKAIEKNHTDELGIWRRTKLNLSINRFKLMENVGQTGRHTKWPRKTLKIPPAGFRAAKCGEVELARFCSSAIQNRYASVNAYQKPS